MRRFVLFALLAAQGAATQPQDSGTVTGQIRTAPGLSVAGIRITAMVAPAPGTAVTEPATLERLTTTDADGRFRLETVRPGRYFITAGFVDTPTYFPGVLRPADARAVVVTAGSILPGIDFALAQSAGVNVTGRVKGIPDNMPAGYIHVALSPVGITRIEQRLDVVVAPDGTFQFQRVGPGTYGVLTNPTIIGPSAINRIEVKDVDVGPIELAIGPMIVGQVTVDDGSPLPTSLTYATAGYPIVSTPSLVSLVAVRPNPISPLSFGGTVRADGAFVVANYQPGEYRITARLPFGYDIKSLTFGDVDLLKTTLKIPNVASATGSVRMVLTKNPQPGTSVGVKVSGHVTSEPPPATAWILMQPSSPGPVSAGAIGETLVRPDGTFEFQRVPPGVYAAQIIPRQATAPQIAIVVEDVDVANVEFPNIRPALAQTAGPPAALGPQVFPGLPAPLAIQPPSYPPGATVTGRVVMPAATNAEIPRTVVLFGPRDGLSVQGPIHGDGKFELQNVPAGNYDARTLPLMVPSVTTRLVVGGKDVSGITLNAPATRNNP